MNDSDSELQNFLLNLGQSGDPPAAGAGTAHSSSSGPLSPDGLSRSDEPELEELAEIEVRPIGNATVTGRRPPLLPFLLSLLFCGILILALVIGAANWLAIAILLLIGQSVVKQFRLTWRRPQIEIEAGEFRLAHLRKYRTSADNVLDVQLQQNSLFVCFRRLDAVEPQSLRKSLHAGLRQLGAHIAITPSPFSAEQVGEVRHALGLPPQVAHPVDREATAFEERLQRTTRYVVVTPTLITLNVMMYLVVILFGGGFLLPDPEVMIRLGANLGRLTAHGEEWRLLTSQFLHFGLLHLLFNTWVFADIGKLVERLVGNIGFLCGYLVSGAVGGAASVVWHDGQAVSAGASGAIFGVYGMLLGFLLVRNASIPKSVVSQHRGLAIWFVIFNVAIGASIAVIDNAAHLGGLAAGFVCGMLLNRRIAPESLTWQFARSAAVCTVGAAAVFGLLRLTM